MVAKKTGYYYKKEGYFDALASRYTIFKGTIHENCLFLNLKD